MASSRTTRYRAAVIGCGARPNSGQAGKLAAGFGIGYAHGNMYRRCGATQLVAAADIDPENLSAFRDEYGLAAAAGHADYRRMLDEAKPDLVSIGTYVGLHRSMIEDAARAGVRGIFCEKPFVDSPAALVAVRRVVAETGVKISICHQRRNNPVFQRARELYNDGTIGDRVMCMAGISGWDLSEWGSHWLDIFRCLHRDEPVEWVMGQCRVRDVRGFHHAIEDHGVAYFKFTGGGFGLVDGGHGVTAPHTMALVGTAGVIRIEGEHTLHIDGPGGRRQESPTYKDRGLGFADDFEAMLERHLDWIEGGDVPPCGLPNTDGSAELNLAAYLSAVRGDRIDLPLTEDDLAYDEWPVEELARRSSR